MSHTQVSFSLFALLSRQQTECPPAGASQEVNEVVPSLAVPSASGQQVGASQACGSLNRFASPLAIRTHSKPSGATGFSNSEPVSGSRFSTVTRACTKPIAAIAQMAQNSTGLTVMSVDRIAPAEPGVRVGTPSVAVKPVAHGRDGHRLKRGQSVWLYLDGQPPYGFVAARVSHRDGLVFSEFGYCFPARLCESVRPELTQ